MFVPFIFTLDTLDNSENYFHWRQFYMYADACIGNEWPFISHERYFKHLSRVKEMIFEDSMQSVATNFCMSKVPTTDEMLALKAYPIPQAEEDALIAKYASQFDCWIDLLKNENPEFEGIIGGLLDEITGDFGEKPEGILTYEYLPKALLAAANKRGIPVIFQGGGVVRQPFAPALNAFSLINDNSAEFVRARYDRFISGNAGVPMLSRKGVLRLFASEQWMMDIHNIDNEPEYDVGVLYNNAEQVAFFHAGQEYMSDQEMSARARERYGKVLIRTRPGFEPTPDALDNSPTCFHFCCKCKRVLGLKTKGMFEAMLAGRIAHEYGSFIFHGFCNHGIEDDSEGPAPIEFINFILFGLCTPFTWLTDPQYLRFLLSGPCEKDLYMRSFEYYTRGISRDDLRFYYMSDDRAYRLGDPLYFTTGHLPHQYAPYYCKRGLHVHEATHIWSEGGVTEFEFDLAECPQEDLIISAVLYAVAYNSEQGDCQTVRCEVNGRVCGEIKLSGENRLLEFVIPQSRVSDKLNILFTFENPQTVQWGDDQRRIAVAFEAIKLSLNGQHLFETAMRAEADNLRTEADNLRVQNDTLRVEGDNLRTEVDNLKTEIDNLRTEADNLRTEAESLGEELSNIRNSRAYRKIVLPIWRLRLKLDKR